jgi:hypothetical protein
LWVRATTPFAVLKVAIKRVEGISRNDGYFIVNPSLFLPTEKIKSSSLKIKEANNHLFEMFLRYAVKVDEHIIIEDEKENLISSLCSFVLDDSKNSKYFSIVSGFIIENQDSLDFKHQLDSIREGVILYSGVKHSNDLSSVGSWHID